MDRSAVRMASASARSAAATNSSADCARVRIICAVTRLAAKSARARRRTARRLANSMARRIPLPHQLPFRSPLPHVAQWHFPPLPLKPPLAIATPGRRREKTDNLQMMSAVMVIVMVVMRVTAFARRLAAHRHPARFTQLRRLRLHAGRDPRHVGNNIGTKPHRVGRACLTGGVAALGSRAIETAEKHNGQHEYAGQVNNPHVFPQGLAIVVARRTPIARHLLDERWRKYDLAAAHHARYQTGVL
jgi:hypothetical protein